MPIENPIESGVRIGGGEIPKTSGFGGVFDYTLDTLSQPIQGLSQADLGVLRSRASRAVEFGTRSAVANLARGFGSMSDAGFISTAAGIKAGGRSNVAANVSNVAIQEQRRQQDLEQARRSQLIQASGLQATFAGLRDRLFLANKGLRIQRDQARTQRQRGFLNILL